jgi:hypothetical protein
MNETGSENLEKIDEVVDEGENAGETLEKKGMNHVRSEKFSDDVLSSDEEELEKKAQVEELKR